MKSNTILVLVLAVLAAIVAGVYFMRTPATVTDVSPTASQEAPSAPQPSIEAYVTQNISSLSPEKEQLGGTFYVTDIEAHGGTGTVEYEDGHNAYTADFTYEVDASGTPSVTSFTLR